MLSEVEVQSRGLIKLHVLFSATFRAGVKRKLTLLTNKKITARLAKDYAMERKVFEGIKIIKIGINLGISYFFLSPTLKGGKSNKD
jgi:hypothetical protein